MDLKELAYRGDLVHCIGRPLYKNRLTRFLYRTYAYWFRTDETYDFLIRTKLEAEDMRRSYTPAWKTINDE